MADLLATAADRLGATLKAHASQTVVYRRGSDTCTWAASIGETVRATETAYGQLEESRSRDFLGQAADLVLAGSVAEPQEGDRIEQTVGATKYTWEVLRQDQRSAFRYCDARMTRLRIHTKLVKTEAA